MSFDHRQRKQEQKQAASDRKGGQANAEKGQQRLAEEGGSSEHRKQSAPQCAQRHDFAPA
jgi:hypothetical protein